ncbi:MAG: hypothetical protein ABSC19_16400 [Syntrophorhabdales bacterium]|jgi:hypothetical protein
MASTEYQQNSQTTESPKTVQPPSLLDDLIRFLEEDIDKAEKPVADKEQVSAEDEAAKAYYGQRRFAARAAVVQDHKKQVLKFLKHLEDNYKAELRVKKDRKAPKWMQQAAIRKALENTLFHEVLDHLKGHTMTHDEGSRLADRRGLGEYARGSKENEYVLIMPDYAHMAAILGIKEQALRLYVNRFVDMDILKELGKDGPRGRKIYAIGFWSHYRKQDDGKGGSQRIWFLKETWYLKEMLRNFTVRGDDGRLTEAVQRYRMIRNAIKELNESGLTRRKMSVDEGKSERELASTFMAVCKAVPEAKQPSLPEAVLDLAEEWESIYNL